MRLFKMITLEGVPRKSTSKRDQIFEDEELQQLRQAHQELTKLVADGEEFTTELQKEKRTRLDTRFGAATYEDHPGNLRLISPTSWKGLTYSTLSRRFFWPGAASDVRLRRNTIWRDTKKGLLKPLPIPQRIWSEITIDFITDLPPSGDGATNCMVVTDRLTKGVELEGLYDISSEAVARRLFERHYPVHGIPTAITSDRGPQFLLGIEQRLSTATNEPRGREDFRIWTNYLQENWLDLLPIAMATINEREATSTGLSPFFFMHGYHNEPIQLEKLQRRISFRDYRTPRTMAQEIQQAQANKHRTAAPRYKPGDWVYLNLRNVKTSRPCKKLDWLHAKYQVLAEVGCAWTHPFSLSHPLPSQKINQESAPPVLVDGQEMYLSKEFWMKEWKQWKKHQKSVTFSSHLHTDCHNPTEEETLEGREVM
ncbi:Pol-like protein [Hirsutella rhossiliensis]